MRGLQQAIIAHAIVSALAIPRVCVCVRPSCAGLGGRPDPSSTAVSGSWNSALTLRLRERSSRRTRTRHRRCAAVPQGNMDQPPQPVLLLPL